MFADEDRKVPGRKRVVVAPKGARLKSADVGVGRLKAGPDRWSEQPGEDGVAALKAEVHRLRSEALPPRSLLMRAISATLQKTLETVYS